MKYFLILLLLIPFTAFAGPLQQINSQEQFNSYLSESRFNGVLLVVKQDQVLLKKAYGVKDFATNTPLTINDKFQIGSVSKQFTAAALLKLQEQKKLSIDDEVVKYLPEYPSLKGIKIRDILNHSAGVANYTDQRNFWDLVDFTKILSLTDIADFIAPLPLDFTPTTKWKYSNSGYILAGRIVEVVSGQSWDQYIQTQFLQPLKMQDTGYAPYFSQVSDVIGYTGQSGSLEPVQEFNMSWALSAGALYSTADDLLKWISIYDSSDLLNENSKTQMQTPFLNNYALGIDVTKSKDETKITHGGRTPGFTTTLTYLKNAKLKIVKFDNTDGTYLDPAPLALSFYTNGKVDALKVKPYPINPEVLNDYVGNYIGKTMNFKVFVKDKVLFLQPNDGQPPYPLVANDKDCFRLLGIAGEEFVRNAGNNVVELKHYQGGGIGIFKKESK